MLCSRLLFLICAFVLSCQDKTDATNTKDSTKYSIRYQKVDYQIPADGSAHKVRQIVRLPTKLQDLRLRAVSKGTHIDIPLEKYQEVSVRIDGDAVDILASPDGYRLWRLAAPSELRVARVEAKPPRASSSTIVLALGSQKVELATDDLTAGGRVILTEVLKDKFGEHQTATAKAKTAGSKDVVEFTVRGAYLELNKKGQFRLSIPGRARLRDVLEIEFIEG